MALLEHEEEQLVLGMYDRGMLVFPKDGITLKSGFNSPYYYNMRRGLSFSKELARSGHMSFAKQRKFRRALIAGYAARFSEITSPVDHVLGKAQAATAFAAASAEAADMSYIWERVDEPNKTYGRHQRIEGEYETGERILIADDVITDGQSKIEGMQTLINVDLVPVAVALQFDREEGGVEMLKNEYGLEVNAVTALSSAVRYLRASNRIGSSTVNAIQKYHEELRAAGISSTYEPPE